MTTRKSFPWIPSERNKLLRCLAGVAVMAVGMGTSVALAEKQDKSSPGSAETVIFRSAKQLFGHTPTPAALRPKAIGFYSRGCLAGGVELPPTGSAWQAMRLKRNRNWGHPKLVELVKKLAIEAQSADEWPGLLVGDLSQPRGGPMLTGHASHQMGLDADIWLKPMPKRVLSPHERESISAVSVVKSRKEINPRVWTEGHAKLLRRAASYPQVARIFVHPPIKRELCKWAGKSRNNKWLRKIRPYYGHHYHFHIRMRCPVGNLGCRDQPAPRPADGTGCGAELAHWYSDLPWKPRRRPAAKPRKKAKTEIPIPRRKPAPPMTLAGLPKACTAVIRAQ